MPPDDPFDLKRFVTAQARVYQDVLEELRAGHKQSHWMWFVFPQLRGLGRSSTAEFYGIVSLGEARAYVAHPTLGVRLDECTWMVVRAHAASLHEIFGSPDDMKFRSSMTLFARVAHETDNPYSQALDRWCGGMPDERTLALIAQGRD